jgi:polysaccharide deacetylase 2 family uncharacterized protein YibQ
MSAFDPKRTFPLRTPSGARSTLRHLSHSPKRTGVAIAIDHPPDVTVLLLAAWLARDHGVTLVPLDEAMRRKTPALIAAR